MIGDVGRAFGDYISMLMLFAVAGPVAAFLLAFGLGWYCGDRWDLPTVTVEVAP